MVLCGLGGIFIEVLKDVKAGLAPMSKDEAHGMIKELKSYKIIQGVRGQEPVNEDKFAEAVMRISALVKVAPEIFEMDLNPLLGNKDNVVAVDARIRIGWKKGFDFFYSSPKEEVNKDARLNQGPEDGNTDASSESTEK